MSANALTIAKRIKAVLADLFEDVATEESYDASAEPHVRLTKTPSQSALGKGDTYKLQAGVTIVPVGQRQAGGTSDNEDVGYQFLVALAAGSATVNLDHEDWPFAVWEQAIRQRFMNRRLEGMTLQNACELHCTIRPGKLPEWMVVADGFDYSTLTLTCFVREQRR